MLEIKDRERPSLQKDYNYSDIVTILLDGKRERINRNRFF